MSTTFGRYRLLERLGKGGMAEVFKAKSYGVEGFEKVIVIKRILPDLAASKDFVDLFIHEAKLAVRLSHANIVQVFDLGIAPGGDENGKKLPDVYYMAMEYVHGFDLATLLAKTRRRQELLPIDMCVYIASEVAKGLDHAHRRRDEQMQPLGIVHRDVSPQNVLVSFEGEVKVTDFGIAKAKGVLEPVRLEDTQSRRLQGKFGFMSPEQASGEDVDARSDLFSLGTVLYECLTGVNPFTGPTTFETLRRVQACEYPPALLLRPDMPKELVSLLETAMAKDPQKRFSDAARMYEALVAFLYTRERRFGSSELSDYLQQRREDADSSGPIAPLPDVPEDTRTPLETASAPPRRGSSPSYPAIEAAPKSVDIERELGERREVTAVVVIAPSRESAGFPERTTIALERYGGRIYSRDPAQVTALFGLSEPDGRDTEMAARAALKLVRMPDGNHRPSAGVHSARIHVMHDGTPTDDERLQNLVAVARDLARAKEGRVAISVGAVRQVRSMFVFETLSDAPAGLSASTTFLIRNVRDPSDAFGRFIGRREELRIIGTVLAEASKRSAQTLTIRGEHGVGKTRVIVEIERRLQKLGYNVGFYVATCPPRGTEHPLSGIVCMLQSLCGVDEADSPELVRSVRPRLRAVGLTEDEIAATLDALGAAETGDASSSGAKRTAGTLTDALRSGFIRIVSSLAEDRPHVFVWDDAHALDTESYGIIQHAFARLATSRIVLAFAARSGYTHPLASGDKHTALELADLPADDTERLIAARLGVDQPPPELVRFVRERAGGHPQFVEELLRALSDARAITIAKGAIVSMRLVGQDLALPKTLRGLVASRVSRLDGPARAALQAAAVLGDPVNLEVLAHMTAQPMARLESIILRLEKADFVVHVGPAEVVFKSPSVREIVVDALPSEGARAMHAAAGDALEVVYKDVAEQATRIAGHLYEAGDRERAAHYFGKSGEEHLAARNLVAAARDFARAIELVDERTTEATTLLTWLTGLAAAVRLVRSAPEAELMCERVIAAVDRGGALPSRVRARIEAGRLLSSLSLFDSARAQFSQAEYIAGDRTDLLHQALVASAELASQKGDFRGALATLQRVTNLPAAKATDKAEEHKLFLSLAQANAATGNAVAARGFLDRADSLGIDGPAACERERVRGYIAYFARDFRAAAAYAERACDLAREHAISHEVALDLHDLGDALERIGDYPRAYGALKQSLTMCEEAGFDRLANHDRMFIGYLDAVAGDKDAERALVNGIAVAEANAYTWDLLGGRRLLAKLHLHRGDKEAARKELERVKALAHETGNGLAADEATEALLAL
jgi:serine/threonine protein kinase/tetratricopeptide (TPR) repeat protein